MFQAQRDLNQARNNELQALVDYVKSTVDFEAAQEAPLQGTSAPSDVNAGVGNPTGVGNLTGVTGTTGTNGDDNGHGSSSSQGSGAGIRGSGNEQSGS